MGRKWTARLVVEMCHRVRLTPARLSAATPVLGDATRRQLHTQIDGISAPVRLTLVSSQAHFGRRWWLQCPYCARRCGVLLRQEHSQYVACRHCLKAHYVRRCPSMNEGIAWAQRLGRVPGPLDHWRQIAYLADPRRRGIRRGRRVGQRLARLFACAPTLSSLVEPGMARYVKWFADESQLQAALASDRQRRDVRTRAAALRQSGSRGASAEGFSGQVK